MLDAHLRLLERNLSVIAAIRCCLAVSMASLISMCMLSLPASFNIALAQTTANNTSATTGTSSADKTGTITSVQNDPAGTWKIIRYMEL